MCLTGKLGRHFFLLCAAASTPASAVMAQNNFAVIHFANATDDVTIGYHLRWGRANQQYTIKAHQRATHYYRYETENRNSYPIPTIEFVTGIDREGIRKHFTLRALASPLQNSGGQWYVFEKSTNLDGGESVNLVSLNMFLFRNGERGAQLLASIDPDLANWVRSPDLLRRELGIKGDGKSSPDEKPNAASVQVQETRLSIPRRKNQSNLLPVELRPYITPEAYEALIKFRLGSKVDAEENDRLQVAYDRAYEEGRYVDAQEANYIRAIEREPVAALWKMLNDPGGNSYYWPKFTPVEERLDSLRQPLVGQRSDRMIYVKSDDDLAGLRLAIRRVPKDAGDGGLETAAILALRWLKGSGVVPLDPPDNIRVLMRLKDEGDHAMLGMSFSVTMTADGTWDLRPEIYTSPKFGEDRFQGAASTVVSPRGCMDCHSLGFNIKATKFVGRSPERDATFTAALNEMPGIAGFLADARKNGAQEQEIAGLESIVVRPDIQILSQRSLKIAVVKLWNAIYYANQPYLDDADSRFIEYHDRYGSAWLEAGDFDKALDHFKKAIARGPEVAALYLKRGRAHLRKERFDDALRDFEQAIHLQPHLMTAHNLRARLLATAPVPSLRNGADAVRAATRAMELAHGQSPDCLDTLAAAYAEAGKFREAVEWQEKALAEPGLARALGENDTTKARNRLELYRQNRPFRLVAFPRR